MEIKDLPKKLPKEQLEALLVEYSKTKSIETRNKIIEHNLLLVMAVIRRQFCSYSDKFDDDDLFQVGAAGLTRGVEMYDITKGFTFATFVVPYIHGYIQRYIERYDIKMPKTNVISMDSQPVGTAEDGEETFLEDYLSSDENVEEEIVANESTKDQIAIIKKWLYANLTERNAQMFEFKFGLTDGVPKTLEATAQKFGMTRERVRQICDKVLRRLKRELLKHKYARKNMQGDIVRDI